MRHLYSGRKLKRTSTHRKALLNNLATALLEHKKIQTTEAKAKELRPFVEKLITRAKNAIIREQKGGLPAGQTVDVHARRVVGQAIQRKAVLQALFDEIAPVVEERNGGYTRIVKLGQRRGDGSRTAVIELVDWSADQDGASSSNRRRRRRGAEQATAAGVAAAAIQEQIQESVASAIDTIEAHAAQAEEVHAVEEAVSEVETTTADDQPASDEEAKKEDA